MLKNKLLSIGIGTLFAFIVVTCAIWCVSTYYDYKMQESDSSSINTESNIGNTSNCYGNTGRIVYELSYPSNSSESLAAFDSIERGFESYPLSRNTTNLLSSTLYLPPPYSEVGQSCTSQGSDTLSVTR